MADASGRPSRWRLKFPECQFDHQDGVKYQAADALSKMYNDGEENTALHVEIFGRNLKNTPINNEAISYVHACTECDPRLKVTTSKSEEDPIKKGENSVCSV